MVSYLYKIIIVGGLLLYGWNGWGQMLLLKAEPEDSEEVIKNIVPQFEKAEQLPIKLSPEMEGIIEYSKLSIIDPMIRYPEIDNFINRYYDDYQDFLLKNGDLEYLSFYYQKYLKTLAEFKQLADPYHLDLTSRRSDFFKQKDKFATRKLQRQHWRSFKRKKEILIQQCVDYRYYLLPALSTEIAIRLQRKHFPKLHAVMNSLTNLDGNPLSIMVFSNYDLQVPESRYRKIAGLSIISKCDNIYTSGNPSVRRIYPGLRVVNNGLTVHLGMFENGVTLSHELGHLYYLYFKWDEYVDYIEAKGSEYEPGGHGPGDPSGHAAKLTEKGVLPF